jgi:tetratricopeptide (TPR) repeat protein
VGIKGDVRSIPLASVLQDLVTNEKTGTLAIRAKDRGVALWFDKGALRLVGLGPREGPSLLNGLLALENIQPEEAPTVTGRKTSEGGFVRGLIKKGRLTRDDLRAALEHQMAEHVCDSFLWAEATFEFDEGEPDDHVFDVDQLDLEARVAVEGLIMEAVRRIDEWGETRKAILSSNEILVPDPTRMPAEADATVRRVFALLDGERSLREIEELTRLGHFNLLRAAALLIRGGAARPVSAAEAFERARARAARKEWDQALRMVRYGLDHERKNAGLIELGLRASEELGRAEDAASFARQLASVQQETGQLEAAIRTYQKVLVHAPKDLMAHERLFALLLQLDLKIDALAQGEALAAGYKKAGLPDKALAVYHRLLEKMGDQPELLESVAEIQRHLGDKPEAVGLYRRLLEKAMQARDDAAALDYCRTILRIDPRNAEALDLRERLETGAVERARRRRRLVRGVVSAVLLAALLFIAAVYEYRARVQHTTVKPAIFESITKGRFREALQLYDSVIEPYRWSVKSRELRPDREQAEDKYLAEVYAEVEELQRHGQLPEAVAALESALPLLSRGELRGEASRKLADLHTLRRKAEEDWTTRLGSMNPPDIAQIRDQRAVPALGNLLSHPKEDIRLNAVRALSAIPGDPPLAALVRALGDASPQIAGAAGATLADRGRTPFQAVLLSARSRVSLAEPVAVEWRISNLSSATLDLTLDEPAARRLQVTGPAGLVALPVPPAGPRTIRLGPNEFVGGTFPDLGSRTAPPGRYQLAWTAPVSWSGKSFTLTAPPIALDRLSR